MKEEGSMYLIKVDGVSIIANSRESALKWIEYSIERGSVPTIELYREAA